MLEDLCPLIGEEGFRFCGIWSKNRWEWSTTLIACMYYKVIVVGFYDSMGFDAVEFILNQTELTSIVCASDYVKKILAMRENGMAAKIKTLIAMDDTDDEVIE